MIGNSHEELGNRKEMMNSFFLAVGFGVVIICFQIFLYKIGFVSQFPTDDTLSRWDSALYGWIAKEGYILPPDNPTITNTGFFIFFPWVWRMLHVGFVGICIFNYLFFAGGFAILTGIYKLSTAEKMVWLSFPTVYIMYIPYSEALFFLLTALLFYAILKKNRWLIWTALILSSLTRATAIFLLPALLLMELLNNDKQKWYKTFYYYFIDYAVPIIISLAFFIWYQYYTVHTWFAYFITQRETEGHKFNWPILPFSSKEGPRNLWISALAIFVCFVSMIVIGKRIGKWLFRNQKEPNKLLVLSCTFLAITFLKTIFYNPTWETGTTLTIGINRYVFATPFFYVFLFNFSSKLIPYRLRDFIIVYLLCNIVWLSCGEYVHILNFIFFNFVTFMVMLYMLLCNKKLEWPVFAIIGMNIFFQVAMFQQYLSALYLD